MPTASASVDRRAVRISPAGRFTTSRARRPIRIASMRPNRAAGSDSRSSAPTTAARRGSRSATSSHTTACRARTNGTTAPRIPWEFKRVWHLEPSLTDPETVYAGVEDAALFRIDRRGQNWNELSGLRGHGTGSALAAGRRRHVPAHDPPGPVQSRPHLHRHLGRRCVSQRRRAAKPGSRSIAG